MRGEHCLLVGRTVVFAVYNATAKLNKWRHLALSSELPGANSSITSETFWAVSTNHREASCDVTPHRPITLYRICVNFVLKTDRHVQINQQLKWGGARNRPTYKSTFPVLKKAKYYGHFGTGRSTPLEPKFFMVVGWWSVHGDTIDSRLLSAFLLTFTTAIAALKYTDSNR